jgi:hypothetical protein
MEQDAKGVVKERLPRVQGSAIGFTRGLSHGEFALPGGKLSSVFALLLRRLPERDLLNRRDAVP